MKKHRVCFCTFLIACFSILSMQAQQRYEAEDALLGGDAEIQNAEPGYSGSGYVNINNTGSITFSVPVQEAGFYAIQIGYSGIFGDKYQDLSVNGQGVGQVSFPATTTFSVVEGTKKVRLNAGDNTVTISSSWGWMLVDYIEIEDYVETPFNIDPNLVNPNASAEARELYEFLKANFGQKVISGVMTLESMVESDWLYEHTGKYPALLGLDFMHNVGKNTEWFVNDPNRVHQVADDAQNYYSRNGIPALCWHWRDPSKQTDAFYTADTDFDINVIYDKNSSEYAQMIADIDVIAAELARLNESGVPVLWRPLHEAAGGWFWWGAKGPQPCKDLWHIMYERLVEYHGLNNLIWVWTADADEAAINWYPGDEYVDIVGIDIYPPAGDHNSQVAAFEKLKDIFNGRKILALSECGSIPDPDEMIADGAIWSYFMPWYGEHTIPGEGTPHNSVEFWNKLMHHELVLTLDQMPVTNYSEVPTSILPAVSQSLIHSAIQEDLLIIQSEESIRRVKVYNMNGALIADKTGNSLSVSIPTASWSKGVYVITVVGETQTVHTKVVK